MNNQRKCQKLFCQVVMRTEENRTYTMEQTEIELSNVHGMHKSAIIYRNNSACFVYVCYHCGITFDNIDDTLQHIESHFQVVNITVDGVTENDDCLDQAVASETFDCNVETMESNDCLLPERFYVTDVTDPPKPVNSSEKQEFHCKLCDFMVASKSLLRVHAFWAHLGEHSFKCIQCSEKSMSHLEFEKHLKMHISHGEVNWKSITDGIDINWSMYEKHISSDKEPQAVRKKIATPKTCKRLYKCHKCTCTLKNIKELKHHFNTHAADEILQTNSCKACDIYFRNAFDLRLHVLEVHFKMKKYNCNVCSSKFTLQEAKQFKKHLQLHKMNDGECCLKGIRCQGKDVKAYEKIDSFAEEQYRCEFCSETFYIKTNLDVHMKSMHSSQRRMQCGQCGSIFTTPKYYFAHQLEHQRVGSMISERDDNVLLANLDASIDEQIFSDENERSYRCLTCNATFEAHFDIRRHIRERHIYKMFPPPLEQKRKLICDVCGISTKTKAAFKNHFLIHTNTKSHPCTICGKKFRQNACRKIHERQHTGEKPFQCHDCGKGFISQGLLTAHSKSHDDSTYPCHICGREFNLPSGYRRHIKTHSQDRAFKCTVCAKSFNTRLYLGKHMYTHAGKQYQCRFCELKFSTTDGRRQHHRHKHQHAPS